MSTKNYSKDNRKGFTLIEILLAIAIIGIFSTTTYAAFTRFNRQQNISVATKNVKNDLAEAKANALSHVVNRCKTGAGNVPGILIGFQITFNTADTDGVANNEYSLQEVCQRNDNGNVVALPAIKTKSLPSGISFGTATGVTSAYIRFSTLSGGSTNAEGDTTGNVRLRSNESQFSDIEVSSEGVIQ